MSLYGGFQDSAFQNDYQTTLIIPYEVNPDYVVVRPYSYRFNPMVPGDALVLTFNFSLALPQGIYFTGIPTATATSLYGDDPNPAAILNGQPEVDSTGTLIFVPVAGGMDMNDYIISAECTTSDAFIVLSWPGILPVRQYPNEVGAP